MRLATNGKAIDTELELRTEFLQRRLGARPTRETVSQNSDLVAAFRLSCSEIQNMTKNSTDGCADSVKDAKRCAGRFRHRQNHRSPTTMVSPGRIMVPGGTVA